MVFGVDATTIKVHKYVQPRISYSLIIYVCVPIRHKGDMRNLIFVIYTFLNVIFVIQDS